LNGHYRNQVNIPASENPVISPTSQPPLSLPQPVSFAKLSSIERTKVSWFVLREGAILDAVC